MKNLFNIILFFCCLTVFLCESSVNNEKRLIKDLLDNLDEIDARPVKNETEAVTVEFGLSLQHIIDLDPKTRILKSHVYIYESWSDSGLSWNPDKYGQLEVVHLPSNKLWKPDVVLMNDLSESNTEKYSETALAYSAGKVLIVKSAILSTACSFDQQKGYTCSFHFGSWVFDSSKLKVAFNNDQQKVEISQLPSDWEIISNTGKIVERVYACCKEIYPAIIYEITIKQK